MSIILPNSMSSLSFIFVFFLFARRPPLNHFSLFRSGIYSKSNYIAYFLLFPTLHTIQFTKQKLMWTARAWMCGIWLRTYTLHSVPWADATLTLMPLWRKENRVNVCVRKRMNREKDCKETVVCTMLCAWLVLFLRSPVLANFFSLAS